MKKFIFLCTATLMATLMWTPGHAQFTESFDTEIPSDWTVIDNDGQGDTWEFSTAKPYQGAGGSAHLYYETDAHDDYLITPQFTVTSGVSDQVSFYALASTTFQESFDVKISNTGTDPANFTIIGSDVAATGDYVEFVFNIPPSYIGQDVYVAVVGTAKNKFHLYLDEFSVQSAPTCIEPTDLTADFNFDDTSAVISWIGASMSDIYVAEADAGDPVPDENTTVDPGNMGVPSPHTLDNNQLIADTHYEVYVRADCGAQDGKSTWAGPVALYTGYCIPTGSGNNTDEILNFTLADLDHDSAPSEGLDGPGYSNYSGSETANLEIGSNYVASITTNNGSGGHGAAIWIDYDDSGTFDASNSNGANEMVAFLPNESSNADATVDFPSFSVMSYPGTHRLRIQYAYGGSGDTFDPCIINTSLSQYSETEDYNVSLTIPDCAPPASLQVATGTLGSDHVKIEWDEPLTGQPGNGYLYKLVEGDATEPTTDFSTLPNTATEKEYASGLTPNSDYYFWIKGDCGSGDGESSLAMVHFKTDCGAVSDFFEDFDTTDTGEVPVCWSNLINSTSTFASAEVYGYSSPYSTPNHFRFYNAGDADAELYLVSPLLTNITSGDHRLRFQFKGGADVTLEVGSISDPNDGDTFQSVGGTISTTSDYEEYIVTFDTPPYAGTFVAFKVTYSGTYKYGYLDDVNWEETPACPKVTGLTVSDIGANEVDLDWDEDTTSMDWDVFVVEHDDENPTLPTGSGTDPSVGSHPYHKTGLSPNTTYDFYVRADCDMYIAEWTGPVTFSTACEATDIPFTQDFEDVTTPDIPNCGSLETNTGDSSGDGWYTSNETSYGFSSNVLAHKWSSSGSSDMDDWYFTQGINLEPGVDYQISFKYGSNSTNEEKLKVAFGTSPASSAMNDPLNEIIDLTFAMQGSDEAEEIFQVQQNGVYYFGFQIHSGANKYYLYVDDIAIDVAPTCLKPTDLTVDNVEETAADLSWTPSGSEGSWLVKYSDTPDFNPETEGMSKTVSSPSLHLDENDGLTAGTAYEFYVQAQCGNGDGDSMFAGPQSFNTLVANDEACTATAIACGDSIIQPLAGATESLDDDCYGSGTSDVWFTFTSDGSQALIIGEGGDIYFDAIVQLFKGDDCGALTEVGPCQDSPEEFTVTEAGTYYFRVRPYSSSSDEGTITVNLNCVDKAINDDLCDAISLTLGATSTGDEYSNVAATGQTDEPDPTCYTGTDVNTVWFSFTAPTSGNVTVSTDIANPDPTLTDTQIALYGEGAGFDCGDLTTLDFLACDQDGGDIVGYGFTSVIAQTGLTAGDTYYVQVDGYGSSTGSFGLEVKDDGYIYVDDTDGWLPSDPNGSATASDNITVMDGEASFISAIEVNDITVMSGATLNVESVLTINGNIDIDDSFTPGKMVFKSTATSNGELAAVPSGSTITGNVTVERYMSAHRSYRFVSSAVTTSNSIHANWQEGASSATDDPNPGFGTHITGTYTTDQENGFDITASGNKSLFTLNVGSQAFDAVGNTDNNMLTAGDDYLLFVRGSRAIDLTDPAPTADETVLRATGTLQIGSISKSMGNVPSGDFVAIANPYQSAINANTVIDNSANLNDASVFVYDPTLGSVGGYVTVALPSGSNSINDSIIPGTSLANQYIQPGQAVQIASSGGAVVIEFAEDYKAPGNHTATFSNENPFVDNAHINGHLYTAVKYAAGEKMHDNFSILFNQSFDNALNAKDAGKPMNFTENMGIGSPSQAYSIERRELPIENEDIALFNTNYENQDYTLVLEVSEFEGTTPYFVDTYTGEQTELQASENVISFSVDQNVAGSIASNRFYIHFGPSTLSVDNNQADYGIQLYPNPTESGAAFYVTAGQFEGQNVSVSITDLLGKTVYTTTKQFNAGKIAIQPDSPLGSGVYFVRIAQDGKTVNKRLVVK